MRHKFVNITNTFENNYIPRRLLTIYQHQSDNSKHYAEVFDIDHTGRPANPHPLTPAEAKDFAQALHKPEKKATAFLQPEGILPANVLYYDPTDEGYAIWYTRPKKQMLYFKDELRIPSGRAWVPALLWKASKRSLSLFALADNKRPTDKTTLYRAPFFNVGENTTAMRTGMVCMGNVSVKIEQAASIEQLMKQWENYFFNSYFSHLNTANITKSPIVTLWNSLIEADKRFPVDQLVKTSATIKALIQ